EGFAFLGAAFVFLAAGFAFLGAAFFVAFAVRFGLAGFFAAALLTVFFTWTPSPRALSRVQGKARCRPDMSARAAHRSRRRQPRWRGPSGLLRAAPEGHPARRGRRAATPAP